MLNNVKQNSYAIIQQIIVILICISVCLFYKTSIYNGLIYYAYQFLCIYIPGCAINYLLRKDIGKDYILWNYSLGLILCLIEYYVLIAINNRTPILIVEFIIAALSIYILGNKKKLYEIKKDNDYYVLFIFIIITIICFFAISYTNPLPKENNVYYNKDFLFWIGNSISFTKGFPVQNFRLVGETFYYHYFSSIIIAHANIVSNIDVVTISFCFSYIIPCVLLSYSSYALLQSLIKNKILIYIGVLTILATEGSTSFLTDHLYICPFGFDYGYSFGMLCITQLIKMYVNDDYLVSDVIISCLLIMATTGFKGPIGLVVLIGYGIIALDMLLKKKYIKGFSIGISWLLSFVFVYCTFISNIFSNVKQTNGLIFMGPIQAFDNNHWAINILSDLLSKGYPNNGITRIISLLLYVINTNKISMILLFIGIIALFYKLIIKNKDTCIEFVLISICIWGILLTINTYQDGNSQMYFIMSVFPYGILLGIYSICNLINNEKIAILIVLLICVLSHDEFCRFVFERIQVHIENAISIRNGDVKTNNSKYVFTLDDHELSMWLKNNTESNDYVAIDCFEYDEIRKEEGVGVFSERFIWNDGQYANEIEKNRRRELVNNAILGDGKSLETLIREKVKYLVITLSQNQDLYIKEKCKLIYESNVYKVYQLY